VTNLQKLWRTTEGKRGGDPLEGWYDSKDSVLGIKDILVSKRKDIYMNILKL